LNIFSDVGSCLSHQKVEEISNDHAEKFLDRPGDERRAKLKEKEVNEPIKRSGVTFFQINPRSSLLESEGVSGSLNDVS
jgi:hypothetical protein